MPENEKTYKKIFSKPHTFFDADPNILPNCLRITFKCKYTQKQKYQVRSKKISYFPFA
jgi:hypothetical protein